MRRGSPRRPYLDLAWRHPGEPEWDIGRDLADPDDRHALVLIAIAEPDRGERRKAVFTLATEIWTRLNEPRSYRVAAMMARAGMAIGGSRAALVRLLDRAAEAVAALTNDPNDAAAAVADVLAGEGEMLIYAQALLSDAAEAAGLPALAPEPPPAPPLPIATVLAFPARCYSAAAPSIASAPAGSRSIAR